MGTVRGTAGHRRLSVRSGEGLYWPGSASPVKLSSPLHLHKCWSGAHTVILAVVPPRAGECRFVRVTSVLIFARAPACVAFVLARTPGQPGKFARSRRAPRPPLRAPPGPAIRPVAIDAPVPADSDIPPQRSAPQTRRHRTTRTLGKDHRAPGETLHHASTLARPPGRATHAVPTAHHPAGDSNPPEPRTTTTHSKEKRLLSISKPRRTMLLCLSRGSVDISVAVLGLRSGCSDRVIAGLRTRQGWAAPGGARKL